MPTFTGANVEVLSDEKKNFKRLFLQDQQMKSVFQAYPTPLCLDATYKLVKFVLPVYLMLCEDSNDMSEIVCVCLLMSKDANSITCMIYALKQHNMQWENVHIVMADKDICKREVIKQYLILLC